jgi:protease secretion system membrane fusion protein
MPTDTVMDLEMNVDTRKPMQVGLWTLGLGFGGFLLWAALAPLNEGVPTQGTVTLDTKRKPVQHLTGGLVREVLVREGQQVEAGQIVARLDTAVTLANYESVRQHYMGLRAMESRLVAEQRGARQISFDPDLANASDAAVRQQVATQRALFDSRRTALEAELRGIEDSVRGQEAMISGYEGQLANQRMQRDSLLEELDGLRGLVSEGYVPRARQLEIERQLAAAQGAMTELQGNASRTRSGISELNQRALQRRQEYHKEGDSQLAEIRQNLQPDQAKLKAVEADLYRTDLKAPVTGQVVGLRVQSIGAVLQPAEKLLDIVPRDEALLVEIRIPPQVIDRVAAGKTADVRFSAFAHSPSLVVEGLLDSVSHDLVSEQTANGTIAYYLGRVSITAKGMTVLGNRQMQPGMPAEVIVKTGERSLLTYLLHPLTRRIAASMKEE